jgi:ferrous iron transport protein B
VLAETYTPLVGFCIMLFCLVSTPCVATVVCTRKESGSWRWALFQLGGLTALAYALTVLAYQAGRLFDIGTKLVGTG